MREIFVSIRDALCSGKSIVLCSIISSSGSTPRGTGAKMIVFDDGSSFGTIGGGAVELEAIQIAVRVHSSGESFTKGFDLSTGQKSELGMICGGNATVYFQYIPSGDHAAILVVERAIKLFDSNSASWLITSVLEGAAWSAGVYSDGQLTSTDVKKEDIEPYLSGKSVLVDGKYYIEPIVHGGFVYIFGGGHVSQALVPVISRVNFRPIVFEDRERFADPALFSGAPTILGDFSRINDKITITNRDYIAIITRGHQADYDVLKQILRTPACYIGLIGSRNKFSNTRRHLLEDGFNDNDITRIHNPIGIPILAETPDEIAVSIAAELIQHRAQLTHSSL